MNLDLSRICQAMIIISSSWSWKWWWKYWGQIYEIESQLNWYNRPLLTYWPFSNVYLSNVEGASFMCLISISTHTDNWKSFMKFGIKKSHEMTSYNLDWIALLSEWKHGMSTKPCNLAQTVLVQLMNKSYERFMLSKCQENASMDKKA